MEQRVCEHIHPGIITMQALLRKIDRLRLPLVSRRDVESILVRQVTKELDRALPCQAGHGLRTAAISLLIGQAVGLTPDELHDLKLAAFLHDIGLLRLPHDLTIGVNRLDPESYVIVQNHPRLGASLLEPFFFLREASVLIAHHHERWDGSGYPYGIRGRFIPLGARILAIADAYDAIKVPDAYPAVRNRVVLKILQVASRTQFDPAWSKSCVGSRPPVQPAMSKNCPLEPHSNHISNIRRHHHVRLFYLLHETSSHHHNGVAHSRLSPSRCVRSWR